MAETHLIILAAIDPTIGVLAAALLGPSVAYAAAIRRFSGKIGSSDASELWTEARSLRDWSASRIAALEARIAVIETTNTALGRENQELVQKIRDLSDTIAHLRSEILELTRELKTAQRRVTELQEAAEKL